MLCYCRSLACAEGTEKVRWRYRRKDKSDGVTLHAENHSVTAHNCQLLPFQKIVHALEVAATVDRREAAFLAKEGKP